jgi:hypothetical protein
MTSFIALLVGTVLTTALLQIPIQLFLTPFVQRRLDARKRREEIDAEQGALVMCCKCDARVPFSTTIVSDMPGEIRGISGTLRECRSCAHKTA